MNVLIVYAHENPKSMNGSMKDLAVEVLSAKGHSVKVSDLYAMGFNPVGSKADFTKLSGSDFYRYQDEQVASVQAGTFAPDVQAEMDKLAWADFVLFQFPLWWFGTPAIMSGWFDRVFAAGFAYGEEKRFDQGMLRGKRAMCALTTGGPAGFYSKLSEEVLKAIHFARLYFCGMDVLPPFAAFAVGHLDDAGRQAQLDEYRVRLEAIESTEPIRFPTMAEMMGG